MTLHSFLRYLNRLRPRCLRLRRVNAESSGATTLPIVTSPRSVSPEIPTSTVIDSPPAFSSVTPRSSNSDADCAVCLSKLDNNDTIRLPVCCHAFHTDCIITWFLYNLSCPLCRRFAIPASDSNFANVTRYFVEEESNSYWVYIHS